MKKFNLKSVMLGLVLLVVCSAANAGPKPIPSSRNYAINTYVDAMTRGKISGVNDVFDPNAKFSMLRGKQVLCFSKDDIIEDLKRNKNVEMECTTNTSIVDSTADYTVVRVDMKFSNFTRSNYVTMVNTGLGWKITNVHSVFK